MGETPQTSCMPETMKVPKHGRSRRLKTNIQPRKTETTVNPSNNLPITAQLFASPTEDRQSASSSVSKSNFPHGKKLHSTTQGKLDQDEQNQEIRLIENGTDTIISGTIVREIHHNKSTEKAKTAVLEPSEK
ncbi:hypothetical protein NK553_08515 [Pseudomonas sp. ZM23]|uniref:Uncharacterized protein n=1 Tax=Pseudomonas triclosanedens TaxID=2961893 RepID=A0ABY7A0D9_9PSED|nr:hypothetical protein [Pseudomonas triclosanedens]MCP8463985.1 hypothetical protein [Pseudomonas triclosanedens]MCP8469069.1 hypothetical protein [Pseudomonas triclosanedens]MCP8475791.1 hypothetical protein [Pseudomonas triclosanedens]WAI50504.1 hypothetical protein OU419_04335 [Pseudomonas triclosanedens]